MALWSAFFPDVAMFVPGCPDPVLEQELRKAARDFFQRTRAWVQWLDPIPTTAAGRDYDLDLPSGAEAFNIERATVNGRPIDVQGHRSLPSDPSLHTAPGLALASADRLSVTLTEAVGAGAQLQVQAVLMPSRSATGIADALMAKHAEAIAEGAKYRLMRTPGPLHKPNEAEEARRLFEAAIAAASVRAWRGHTNTTPRATPKWC